LKLAKPLKSSSVAYRLFTSRLAEAAQSSDQGETDGIRHPDRRHPFKFKAEWRIRRGWKSAAVVPPHHPSRPTPSSRHRCGLSIEPDQPVGGERRGALARAVEERDRFQPPAAATVTVFQQEVEVATTGIIRGAEMLKQHVSVWIDGHGFHPQDTTPTLQVATRIAMDSAPSPAESTTEPQDLAHRFRDRFETLLPEIQRRWPEVTHQALEATRGSLDDVVHLIATHSDRASMTVRHQLEELMHQAGDRSRHLADSLEPLEEQLEQLLDDLNRTLRPKLEKPLRERPLLSVAVAAGVGVLVGALLSGGRRSS